MDRDKRNAPLQTRQKNNRSPWTRLLPPIVIFLASFLVYAVTLRAGFVYDDNVQVLSNPWIRDLSKVPLFFVSSTMSFLPGQPANTYRPVFYIVYTAEYLLFGTDPLGWHLVNITMHALNALAVYALASVVLARRSGSGEHGRPGPMGRAAPLLAGLVFGLHPLNSEVASWVGAVPELVFTLMVLSAFILYVLAGRSGKKRTLVSASLACFTVALFSKETAMALIIIIPLYELTRLGLAGGLRRWRHYAPYLVPAALYMAMRTYALGGMTQMRLMKMTAYEGVLNVFPLVARYLGKLILPRGLTIIYSFEPVHSALEPMFLLGLLGCAAFAALVYLLRRMDRETFFLLWIIVPLLPVLYMPVLSVGGFADRYLYLSTAGFACFWASLYQRALGRGGGRRRALGATLAALAVLAAYTGASVQRGLVWSSDLTLWTDAVKKSPKSPNALYNLAWTLHRRGLPGDKDRALGLYEEAVRIKPDKEDAHYNAALIYQERGEYGKALEHYAASLRSNPGSSSTYYNMAMIYQAEGLSSRAIEFFRAAVRADPRNEDALYNLAWSYQDAGEYDKALEIYNEVVGLDPSSVDAHFNMGVIYEERGMNDRAVNEYRRALSLNPGYGPARFRLQRLLRGPGRARSARPSG